MIPVDVAIYRVKRDITLGMLVKALLVAAVFATVVFSKPAARLPTLAGVLAVWVALGVSSARSSLLANQSPTLIAAGEFEEAERQIELAMRAFSVFGPTKLRALHHLAVLRHAQKRWQEAAALSRALLRQRLASARGLTKPSGLILTESLLEMNDLTGAHHAIMGLYAQSLALDDLLNLLPLQLDYEAKIGQWAKMFTAAVTKVQLAELMPSKRAARVQALLALSAMKCGRPDWAQWLRQRAELLVEVNMLAAERPILWSLWTKSDVVASSSEPPAVSASSQTA